MVACFFFVCVRMMNFIILAGLFKNLFDMSNVGRFPLFSAFLASLNSVSELAIRKWRIKVIFE